MTNLSKRAVSVAASLSGAALYLAAMTANAGTADNGALIYAQSVPEPSGLALMAGGAATAILLARAKRKK